MATVFEQLRDWLLAPLMSSEWVERRNDILLRRSYAKGKQTKNSDIDLLFIVPDGKNIEQFKNKIENNLKILSYKIDINVISESDFINLKSEQNINIHNQIVNNHIILYGAENYYRLIS